MCTWWGFIYLSMGSSVMQNSEAWLTTLIYSRLALCNAFHMCPYCSLWDFVINLVNTFLRHVFPGGCTIFIHAHNHWFPCQSVLLFCAVQAKFALLSQNHLTETDFVIDLKKIIGLWDNFVIHLQNNGVCDCETILSLTLPEGICETTVGLDPDFRSQRTRTLVLTKVL